MRTTILLSAYVMALVLSHRGFAQESSPQMITIEIVIAEFSAGGRVNPAVDLRASDDIAARIRELDEQQAITSLTRANLTAFNNLKATAQIGHRVPMRTGRMSLGRRGEGGGAAFQTVTELQHVGTLFSASPRILDDGKIAVELLVEKSDVRDAPTDQSAGAEDDGPSTQRVSTLTTQTTVTIPPEKFVVVAAWSESSERESGQIIVLASARLGE